ncbi:hypothetical protein C0Q70_06537 [Pomacea canaliculata]|uniref:Uncharacterized protein n=1 Tax=Pomacea canaliculata TaxID=400727 RepID=A0A2T7PPA2_POMCA|nr:hypothetical protein C0Q70_06537 [Pomacea canaliculata]
MGERVLKKHMLTDGHQKRMKFSNLLGAVYRRGNIEFLPDGDRLISPVGNRVTVFDLKKFFAVTRDKVVLVFHTPGKSREFNPFVLYRTFYGAFDDTTCIDWSSDSKLLVVGSKCMLTHVFAIKSYKNLLAYSMGGHIDAIVGAFFEHNSMDVYSASRRGHLCVWKCNINTGDLVPKPGNQENVLLAVNEEDKADVNLDSDDSLVKVSYKKLARHVFKSSKSDGESAAPELTSCVYHKPTHILFSGFDNGAFLLHEMPDFNLIHSLRISDQSIASIAVNKTGDWVALGCRGMGQLLVWEWQSESYILKQQSHHNNMSCVAYSSDGHNLATGGDDGKL